MISVKGTLKSVGTVVSGSLVQSVLKIILLGIFARLLTPSEFGIYNAALVVIGFITLLNELGLGAAIVQKGEISKETVSTAFFSSVVLGIILMISTFFLSKPISVFFGLTELNPVIEVVSVLFFVESFGVASKGLLQRGRYFKQIVAADVLAFIIGYGLIGGVLVYLDFSYWALVFGTLIQSVIRTCFVLKFAPVNLRLGFSILRLKELLKFGSGFTLARTFNYFALNSDNFVISRYLGSVSLGLYGRAYQIMVFPSTLVGGALDKVLFSTFSEFGRNSDKRAESYYVEGLRFSLLFSNLVASIFYFNADLIVSILLGENWMEVVPVLKFLSFGLVFRLAYKMNVSVIRSKGWVFLYAASQLVYFLFVLLTSFYAYDKGIDLVALVVSGSILVNYVITLIIATLTKVTSFHAAMLIHVDVVVIGGLMWLIGYLLNMGLSMSGNVVNINRALVLVLQILIVPMPLLVNARVRELVFKKILNGK